jgi:hypothetical protein
VNVERQKDGEGRERRPERHFRPRFAAMRMRSAFSRMNPAASA